MAPLSEAAALQREGGSLSVPTATAGPATRGGRAGGSRALPRRPWVTVATDPFCAAEPVGDSRDRPGVRCGAGGARRCLSRQTRSALRGPASSSRDGAKRQERRRPCPHLPAACASRREPLPSRAAPAPTNPGASAPRGRASHCRLHRELSERATESPDKAGPRRTVSALAGTPPCAVASAVPRLEEEDSARFPWVIMLSDCGGVLLALYLFMAPSGG